MDNNNRRYADEEDSRRGMDENQRIGRQIARERGDRNWNEQYRSGQNYHNRNEGYGPDQNHYGSQPNSAYRDQSRINYGDDRHDRNNQDNPANRFNNNNRPNNNRFDNGQQSQDRWQQQNRDRQPNQYRFERSDWERQNYDEQNRDNNRHFNDPPRGYHGGTQFWGEREEYKEDDYRYRSGHRGNWHAPDAAGSERDEDNRFRNQHDQRGRNQDEGFFDRIGNSISNTWREITNFGDDDRNDSSNRYSSGNRNQNFNRGYERGPRWADESDNERYERENRYNRERRNRGDWD